MKKKKNIFNNFNKNTLANNIFYKFYKKTLALKDKYDIEKLCLMYSSIQKSSLNIVDRISRDEFEELRKMGNKVLSMNSKINILLMIIKIFFIIVLIIGETVGKSCLMER